MIDILGSVVEYRNLESGEHIKRVKGYTRTKEKAFQMIKFKELMAFMPGESV